MNSKDVYLMYSGATDVTGRELESKLGISGGKEKPTNAKVVIGWGAKTKDDVTFPNTVTVLNHPNRIRQNRNKLEALKKMEKAHVNVANFVSSSEVVKALNQNGSKIVFPLIARTSFHQGGKGLWFCATLKHVEQAIQDGAQYFQNYIDIVDEYRVHIFNGECVCVQKKTLREEGEREAAFLEQHRDKLRDGAEKNKVTLDQKTVDFVLGKLAKENAQPDLVVRSNKRGWKFVKVTKYPNELLDQSEKALKALGLDFGAVDCCIATNKKVYIIEVNTGPGLQGTVLDSYVEVLKKYISGLINKKAEKVATAEVPKATMAKKPGVTTKTNNTTAKTRLESKLDLLKDLVGAAEENEAEVLERLAKKIFG